MMYLYVLVEISRKCTHLTIVISIIIIIIIIIVVVKETTYIGCVCIFCFYVFLETVSFLYATKIYAGMNVAVSILDCQ